MQVATKEARTWLGGKRDKTWLGWNCWVYTILSSTKAEDALQVLPSHANDGTSIPPEYARNPCPMLLFLSDNAAPKPSPHPRS